MEGIELKEPPSFDGRIVLYPTTKHLRDYLSWRQADVHVNNLFNTVFWALVDRGGKSPKEAEATLKGTLSKDKHEILFTQFNINYNNEPQIFRKGSFIVKNPKLTEPTDRMDSKRRRLDESTAVSNDQGISPSEVVPVDEESKFLVLHVDIIEDKFWAEHPHLLAPSDLEPPRIRKT